MFYAVSAIFQPYDDDIYNMKIRQFYLAIKSEKNLKLVVKTMRERKSERERYNGEREREREREREKRREHL